MTIVTTEAELRAALAAREAELVVEHDINLTTPINIGYALAIRGMCGVSLFWTNPSADARALFRVTAGGALTLASLVIDGGRRDGDLVSVEAGGTLNVAQGAVLRNVTGTAARAVRVSDGTFRMDGGLVTGVTSAEAVFIDGGTAALSGTAQVRDNAARGMTLSGGTLTIAGRARIIGNRTATRGGGVSLANGARLNMGGNAVIACNTAVQSGGGVYIGAGCEAHLSDHALVERNTALSGDGIHSDGTLTLAGSPRVLDGVLFDTAERAPVITAPLVNGARISVACSGYVSPQNLPVALAVAGGDYAALTAADRAAFPLPGCFHEIEHQIAPDQSGKQVQIQPMPPAVHFYPNGGCVRNLPRPVAIEPDGLAKLPCAAPRRAGYRFLCWNTSPWGDGQSALPCQPIRTAMQPVKLYARWVRCR